MCEGVCNLARPRSKQLVRSSHMPHFSTRNVVLRRCHAHPSPTSRRPPSRAPRCFAQQHVSNRSNVLATFAPPATTCAHFAIVGDVGVIIMPTFVNSVAPPPQIHSAQSRRPAMSYVLTIKLTGWTPSSYETFALNLCVSTIQVSYHRHQKRQQGIEPCENRTKMAH